jgi:hypothetical protein
LGLSKTVSDEVESLLADLHDRLTGIALYKEITPRMKDYVVSFGERLSVRIVAAYFNSLKIKAEHLDAWEAGFVSDGNFTSAEILKESWDNIPSILIPLTEKGVLPVITGFIAKNMEYAGAMSPNPAIMSNHVHFYIARDLVDTGKQDLDSDEFVNIEIIPAKDVIRDMGRPPYVHALMASALCFYLK